MRLIHTKDDGLVHWSDLSEDLRCYEVCTLIDDNRSVKIIREIDSFLVFSLDDLISTRESEFIDIELDPLDLEWCEESIIDPLSEGIFVDGLAKIGVGIDIIISLRSCCESEVDGRGEVAEDLCPVTIFSRTTSMTFIDDNEIKKISLVAIVIWLENFFGIIFARSSRECLINGEENICIRRDDSSSSLDLGSVDLEAVFLQWVERIHRLIYENIAIGEDEDTRSTSADPITRPPRLEELVRDLKCNHRLTGTGREGEENTISTFSNILHYLRYCDLLIVSRTS